MESFTQNSGNRFHKRMYGLLFTLIISLSVFSQNVGINATGSQPNASAGLDVDFANKGLLIPRVALTSTSAFTPLSAHVAGMVVYNTATTGDVTPGFYYDNGTKWIPGFIKGQSIGDMLYWNGTDWLRIPIGVPGQYLQISGTFVPSWGGNVFATLSTTSATSITGTTAVSGGNIISDGGTSVVQRGVCWNTVGAATIGNTKTSDGTGTGIFSSNLSGLLPGTQYYVRAYSLNTTTLNYGNEITFTTAAIVPTLAATTTATLITGSSATTGGNVTVTGGAPIIERGICYSTTVTSPTIANTTIVDPAPGLGIFVSNMTGLTPSTTYYVRSYATNSVGTAYGSLVVFATRPVVTTTAAGSITGGSAVVGGVLTGGSGSWYYGVAYSTVSNAATPTLAQAGSFPSTSPITYSTTITGLTSNTTYYIRGYVAGSGYTIYGQELSFTTTAPTAPTIASTTAITGLTANTANSGGTISNDGGSPITLKGVCWGTSTDPVLGVGNYTSNGTGSAAFISNITGLTGSTTYYVRAYATNSVGTGYGPTSLSFTTWVQAQYTLGQVLSYGIVGYIAPDGSGFIVSPEIPSLNGWGCNGVNVTGTSAALGTGMANTTAILACSVGTTTAASVARSYNGGGFNDWYLPSSGDWAQIALNYYWYGLYGNKMYYTSSQYGTNYNYASAYFHTGSQAYASGLNRVPNTNDLSLMNGIRAIRNFSAATLPAVTTGTVTNITGNTALAGGNVTSDGGATITAGVCWSTLPSPTIADSKTSNVTTVGSFSSNLTGLTILTTYYVRAYVTNVVGTSYGSEVSFTTNALAGLPSVSTDPMGSIVGSLAEGNYTVVNEGGSTLTEVGLCWGTSPDPTVTTNTGKIVDPYYDYVTGTSVGSSWPLDMTGLTVGTVYHVRAFATNSSSQTAYGTDVSFTATAATLGQNVYLNYQPGVVFSISNGGNNGLIALSFNPGNTTDWGCSPSSGAGGTAIGTGSANTDSIIAKNFSLGCTSLGLIGAFAADVTKWYGIDWYLPSKDELDLLIANQNVDIQLSTIVQTYLQFWSSSAVDPSNAWYLDATTATPAWVSGLNSSQYYVWPIRSF